MLLLLMSMLSVIGLLLRRVNGIRVTELREKERGGCGGGDKGYWILNTAYSSPTR